MTPEDLDTGLQNLLKAHGVELTLRDGWLRSGDGYPALRAAWYPHPNDTGRLDIQVALQDGRVIEECFAGVGEGSEGLHDALRNFSMSSLHVLLAVLWDRLDGEQVDVEEWQSGSATWKAYIGAFVHRVSSDPDVEYPNNAFEVVQHAAEKEALAPGLHWIRTFFCDVGNGETVIEALLDNDTWAAGAEAYARLEWQKGKGFYSLRNFLMLEVPQQTTTKGTGVWSRTVNWLVRGKAS
ncbi:DUF6348 family protein [Pelagibius marinus]|uniref:DUF6348 family protein n=1 Tax=Pelagibius marinus TaxID=2762760 RepID=UPI00187283A0|nr:DUF6348 family protein [Pelagibius marinus]